MRIRILLVVLTAIFLSSAAAQDTTSQYQQDLDHFLQYLDKSQIPTGILYNRVAPIAELDTLSDVITNNTNPAIKTSSFHFLQAWQELYSASYNRNSMLKPEWLDALITEKRTNNVVPIGVLNYQFDIFDSAAMDDNLIYQTADTMLHDVTGRSRLPYITKEIFLAAPLVYTLKAGSVTFELPANMVLQNRTVTLSSVDMDFGNGQIINLIPGGSATLQMESGIKTITSTANFSNGTQKKISSTVEIISSGGSGSFSGARVTGVPEILPCNNSNIETIDADISFPDYNTSLGKKGEINVGYYYANCADPTIRKPIIILDGFDPGDLRGITGIYSYLYYDRNGITTNLGEELRQQGYDIVVVNFPNVLEAALNTPFGTINFYRDGGADYIERNALVLVKLITIINQKLQQNSSQEKIVIVGPSMGGLISRYALAYMEKNGMNHNCRLWVSFDSPHLGANIPIGAQWWLEYYKRVAGNKGAGDALDKQIGSPAAQQMLIDHWIGHVPSTLITIASSPVRNQFIQNLQTNGLPGSNGMPQNLLKVALTNGSGSGVLQGTACSQVLNMKGYSRNWVHFIPLIGPAIRTQATESNIYFSSDYGNTCKVFDGWYAKFVWNKKQYEEKYSQTTSNTRSYDIVPGGYYNTIEFIKNEATLSDALSYTNVSNVINNHSFIPTVSALALSNPNNRDWSENLSTRNLVCTGETPFNAYYTPVNNEEHVFLTASSADWVKAELNNLPAPSPYTIQRIAGNEPICESTATFKVMNLPAGATVTWSTISNNISINSVSGEQTTVSRISNGTATLIATVNTCAGTTVLNYYVSVGGYGSGDYPVSGPSNASCGSYVTYTTNQLAGATNYSWFYPSGWTYISGQGTYMLTLMTPYSSSYGQIGVRVANACDPGGSYAIKTTSVSCYGYYSYSVSPNPATSDVLVTSNSSVSPASKQNSITEINIYDGQSNLRKHQLFNKVSKANINVSGLPLGIYIIEIINGNYKEIQKLSIIK